MRAIAASLTERSFAGLRALEANLALVLAAWVACASALAGLRIAFSASPVVSWADYGLSFAAYGAMIAAPAAAGALALRAFARPDAQRQPGFRLARLGQWRSIARESARRRPEYGNGGFMFSLIVGMLLTVVLRAIVFLVSMPGISASVPGWYAMLFALTLGDFVVLGMLYSVTFAAALQHWPLFPRLLVATWMIDIAMQLFVAKTLAAIAPPPSAVLPGLVTILDNNIQSVLISVVLWMPYLMLSRRVNTTFRNRVYCRRGIHE